MSFNNQLHCKVFKKKKKKIANLCLKKKNFKKIFKKSVLVPIDICPNPFKRNPATQSYQLPIFNLYYFISK